MTMVFSTASGAPVVVVPRAAVQTIGGRQVVFVAVADEEGRFVQRTVKLGSLVGESYPVLQGLQRGEVVVTEGSFFLRAESLTKRAIQLTGSLVFHRRRLTGDVPTGIGNHEGRDVRAHRADNILEETRIMREQKGGMRRLRTILAAVVGLGLMVMISLPFSLAQQGDNIEQKIREAKTPADHQALATCYEKEAQAAEQLK